ncbi:MAG TPA: carboxylating nicotinate-nucleotide diphosphorylase, partial [Candidatus Thermoplasmatota archaeon]|nr:carboxylating nicotinate-nucleotide diphosphorylase [Candidatus Thermoplasmatota archaeon]
ELLAYLREDVGGGDITTAAILAAVAGSGSGLGSGRVRGVIVTKQPCVVAGLAEASEVFAHLGAKVEHVAKDGERVLAGRHVLRVVGPASAVLTGERLALNLLMRMSGIATLTREMQDKVEAVDPRCRVAATRKTTPGFRRFEKRAVELGGGDPHRFGLHDAFLVKDNHLHVLPDVKEAVRRCRALDPDKFLQVEADAPEQALLAAEAGADGVLLDNFGPELARETCRQLKSRFPQLLVEVSGGITPSTVALYAGAADRISMGWLTHSAAAVDFGLDLVEDGGPVDVRNNSLL